MSPPADGPSASIVEATVDAVNEARVLASLPAAAVLVALVPPPHAPDVADDVVRDLADLRAKALADPGVVAAADAAVREARRPPVPEIDPGVELLIDVPITTLDGDTLARKGIAQRLVELATAAPLAQPRVVALTGGAGTGKSSVINLASAILREHPEVAFVDLDANGYTSADALNKALVGELTEFFSKAGVVDTSDAVRDALSRYGGIVSDIARVAGIKVDLAGAVKRPASKVLAEIAEMTQEVGKRLVIVIDHLDRLPLKELTSMIEALRHYAAIAYLTIVIAIDRRGVALRNSAGGDLDPALIERLITVELRLPPADPGLLANLVLDGLARLGERLGRSLAAARALFDLDDPDGGPALALIDSPRDAKRVLNALAAELPLAADGEVRDVSLDVMLRLLVPELDSPRLDKRVEVEGEEKSALLDELERAIVHHRRAGGARVALRALFAG
ncbi:MAG TPA: P-loop NTPase fold protein [Kofleriaceae bacterium]|nr:P-loop NTPase fold protein [Kofleriaceae bacterium]